MVGGGWVARIGRDGAREPPDPAAAEKRAACRADLPPAGHCRNPRRHWLVRSRSADAGLQRQSQDFLDLPGAPVFRRQYPLREFPRFNAHRGEYGPGEVEQQVAERMALARERKTYAFERERPNGTVLDVRGVPLQDGSFLTTYMDITERHRSEAKIAYMARHDELTGLPNRTVLRERLDRAIKGAREGDGQFAVHVLDLDRFKEVNDTLGHPVGDELLKAVAQRLHRCVRETDTLARLGGDELCIIQRINDIGSEPPHWPKGLSERSLRRSISGSTT